MNDVLLIYPPSYFSERKSEEQLLKNYNVGKTKMGIWPPLGLLYIAASLRNKGISVDIIDAFMHGLSLNQILDIIAEKKPKVIGISVTTLQIRAAVQIAEGIKKIFNNSIFVAAGGPHISIDPDFVRRFDCFDFGVVGEAEYTFPEAVQNILRGEKPQKIYISSLPEKLDELPPPARDIVNIHDYFPSEEPYFTLSTMRGCPFRCIFCSRVAISDKVRYHTPARAIDELEVLIKKHNVKTFVFIDDTFTLNKNHTLELCEEINKRNLKIKWCCNTRANTVDLQLLQEMKKSGCHMILVGVESGDECFRNKVVNKRIDDKDFANLVKWCKELKITVGCYLMLGFPGETLSEIKKTVDFAIKFDMDIMSIHVTTVYPGSRLYEIMLNEGRKDLLAQWDKYAKGEIAIQDLSLVYIPKGLHLKDLQRARKRAYLKFYFRPKIILRQLLHDLSSWQNLKRDFITAIMLLRFGKTSKDLH